VPALDGDPLQLAQEPPAVPVTPAALADEHALDLRDAGLERAQPTAADRAP